MPYPSASETVAGMAAVEFDRLLINEKTTPTTTMKEIITITKLRVPLSPPDVVATFLPIYPIQIYLLESSKGKYPMPTILYP